MNFCSLVKLLIFLLNPLISIASTLNKQLIYKFFSFKNSTFTQIYTTHVEVKVPPSRIENILCWDGSFLAFCQDRDKINSYLMVYEWETPPSWVNLGFKFKYNDSNVEYQECEDEFDKKNQDINLGKAMNVNLQEKGYARGFLLDSEVYTLIREESKKKDKNTKLLSKLYKRMNVDI